MRKTAIALDENELIRLEQIVTDDDKIEAFRFLKKVVYDRILLQQQGKLKSHLDTCANPVDEFTKHKR